MKNKIEYWSIENQKTVQQPEPVMLMQRIEWLDEKPRIVMALNEHDKPRLEKALESHPELIGKAYVVGNALYVNGQGPDLSALYNTWRNLPK